MGGRAAIYCRVSTVDQGNGASLHTQRAECLRYCQAVGLTAVADFQDLQSGMKADREHYQEMLGQARNDAFDVIVIWKLDRFGRDRLESGFQVRELQKIGVRVDSATEPNDSPLLRHILMDFAEEESRRISVRVAANKRTRAQNGLRTSIPPFGYSNVAHPGGGKTLEPNQDAPIVTEVFEMYASGKHTLADLRDYIKTASSSPKQPGTRAGVHHLLKNPVYAGTVRYGYWAKSRIQLKSKSERQEGVFEVSGHHPPLVDSDTFHKVQLRLQSNRPQGQGRPHAKFLFGGLVRCACGYRFSAKTARGGTQVNYYCVRKNDAGDCDSHSINENRIRAAVLRPIENVMAKLARESVRARVMDQLGQRQEEEQAKAQGELQGVADRLHRLGNRMQTWLEMVGDGEMDRAQYAQLRAEYGPQIVALKAKLSEQPQAEPPDTTRLSALADALAGEPPDDEEWREVVGAVLDSIVIKGRDIEVTWQEWFKPLLNMASS